MILPDEYRDARKFWRNRMRLIFRCLCTNHSDVSLLGPIPSSLFIWLPFQLPPNTPFIGNKVVAGQACTGWKLNINIEGASAMTVWVSKNTTTIVQIDVDNLKYLGDVQINFFNTVVGPFSPSIYVS